MTSFDLCATCLTAPEPQPTPMWSPTANFVTFAPTSFTTPASSWPGTQGYSTYSRVGKGSMFTEIRAKIGKKPLKTLENP